jgi:cytochrome c oxidase cbb3-type subunit III
MQKLYALFLLFFTTIIAFSLSSFHGKTNTLPHHNDSFNLNAGKIVFSKNCAGCHGDKGQGSMGPNLTDKYWIHGHHYHNLLHVIKHGASSKGMPSFGHKLTHSQVRDVAHYIVSLKNSNPAGAKASQGKYCP